MNIYIFLMTSVFIYMVQVFAILLILYIVAVMVGWPIKYFAKSLKTIIKRAQY